MTRPSTTSSTTATSSATTADLVDASDAGADATAQATRPRIPESWSEGGGGLLLVIVLLVAAGLVLLVTGFIENALIVLYLSIGCAAVAGVGLIVFSRRSRRSAPPFESATDTSTAASDGHEHEVDEAVEER